MRRLLDRPDAPHLLYALLAFAMVAALQLRWPIVGHDADLWYHLAGGRQLAAGTFPTQADWSFLLPVRRYVDYSWLSQLLFYGLWRTGGYGALAIFRAAAYLTTGALAWAFLARDRKTGWGRAWAVAVGTLVLLLLAERDRVVRPHLLSYLLLVAMLCVLELKPRLWLSLPIAILWVNVHGIVWPVETLVCGAYLLTRLHPVRADRATLLATGLPLAAPLATPLGWQLFVMPFLPTGDASHWIGELARPKPIDFLAFRFVRGELDGVTIANLFLVAGVVCALRLAYAKRIRVGDFVLFAGGVVLATQGYRFVVELALLSLPLLRSATPEGDGPPIARRVAFLAAAGAALFPMNGVRATLGPMPAWPFSRERLPEGVSAFLEKEGGGGRVLHDPERGGYLEWRLPPPTWRLYADMQIPHAFPLEDLVGFRQAMKSPAELRALADRWQPEFLAVPIEMTAFPATLAAAGLDYAPVFFDDSEVLYASRAARPALAGAWELHAVDPFRVTLVAADASDRELAGRRREEIKRILEIDPGGIAANFLALGLDQEFGDAESAMRHRAALFASAPEFPRGTSLPRSVAEPR